MKRVSTDELSGVLETLLPVLFSRVVETQRPDAIFKDPVAVDWVSRIDYDFTPFESAHLNNFGVAIRTEILDEYVSNFIATYPKATIVNMGAGLDTRFYRMDNGFLHWIELDLEPSIKLRRQLMHETKRHRCLIGSVLETDWMSHVDSAHGVLFIIEGLLMYFEETQVKQILSNIADRFPGAQILIEVIGESQAKRTHMNDAISKTDAEFRWGIRDTSKIANWHPYLIYQGDTSVYDRHHQRWMALDIEWKGKTPADYRDSVDRIVHLRVTNIIKG